MSGAAPPLPGEAVGDRERIAKRRLAALTLRIRGASYQQIADELSRVKVSDGPGAPADAPLLYGKVSKKTAYEDVQAELLDTRELTKDAAEEARQLELSRLDSWTVTASLQFMAGNVRAGALLATLSARRTLLLGINAPIKVAPTSPDGQQPFTGIDVAKLTDAQLAALEDILSVGAGDAAAGA